MSRILLTVPTWNEAVIIERNLGLLDQACARLLAGYDWTVEVSDNGSTDATRDIVRRLSVINPRLRLREIATRGKGGAIRESWLAGRGSFEAFVFSVR